MKECEQLEQRFKLGTPVQVGRGVGCRAQLSVLPLDVPSQFLDCSCYRTRYRACSHCCPADPLCVLPSRQATVLHVDGRKHALDVSLLPASSPAAAAQPSAGTLLLGRVTAVAGGSGVRLQLTARSTGRVALTDIHDAPVQQALAGLKAGQYCRAAVLGPDPTAAGSKRKGGDSAQLLLSLRPSAGGQCAAHAAAQQQQGDDTPQVAAGPLQAGQLKQGQRVRQVVWSCSGNCPMLQSVALHDNYANSFLPARAHSRLAGEDLLPRGMPPQPHSIAGPLVTVQVAGYVKSAGPAGVFVSLARNLDARIR